MTELNVFSHSKTKYKVISTKEKIKKENTKLLCESNKQIFIESFPSNIINAPIIPKLKVLIDPPILNLNQMVINKEHNIVSNDYLLFEDNKKSKKKSKYHPYYSLKDNSEFIKISSFTGSSKCLTILSLLENSINVSNKRFNKQFINQLNINNVV